MKHLNYNSNRVLIFDDIIEDFKKIIPDSRYISSIEDGMKDSDEFMYLKTIGDFDVSQSIIEVCGIRLDVKLKLIGKTYCKNTPEILKLIIATILFYNQNTNIKVSTDSMAIYEEETGLTLGQDDAEFFKITFNYSSSIPNWYIEK